MEIYDNLLSKYYLKELQECFLQHCEWRYCNNTTYGLESDSGNLGAFGFGLRLFGDNQYSNSFAAVLSRALLATVHEKVEQLYAPDKYSMLRARADMTMYNSEKFRHEFHTDAPFPHVTAIFYLNTSDGNTIIADREVEPVENRLVIFDGLIEHTGHSPSQHKNRVLINMNFCRVP